VDAFPQPSPSKKDKSPLRKHVKKVKPRDKVRDCRYHGLWFAEYLVALERKEEGSAIPDHPRGPAPYIIPAPLYLHCLGLSRHQKRISSLPQPLCRQRANLRPVYPTPHTIRHQPSCRRASHCACQTPYQERIRRCFDSM